MGRLFASWIAVGFAALLGATDFGRFGYVTVPTVPGWRFTESGIRPVFPRSDTLFFEAELGRWQVQRVRAHEAVFRLVGAAKGPTQVRANLFAPGPEVRFERGFRLRFTTLAPPMLTWSEGSVGEEVDTPKVRWIAISYQDSQPPVLLTFLDGEVQLKMTGKTGQWELIPVNTDYRGWVRFALPLGVRAMTTTDAASLGQMITKIRRHQEFFTGPSPVLQRVTAVSGTDVVTGVWRFSGPNAVVPPAAFLARRGGYNVQIQSEIREADAPSNEGPVAYTPSNELRIRFPVLELPRGRGIAAGTMPWKVPPPDSKRLFSIYNSGIAAMVAARPITLPNQLSATLSAYLADAPFSTEPNTKARLPFLPNGQGAGEAGVYSVLQQALMASEGSNLKPNALFTSLLWARDVLNWQIPMIEEPRIRRRASATAAVAGALSADPMMRLNGAMFQAGLAGERGLTAWLGRTDPPQLLEPVEEFRLRLFKAPQLPRREPVLPMLVAPLRVLIGPPLAANHLPNGYRLRWIATRPGYQRFTLSSEQWVTVANPQGGGLILPMMPRPNRIEFGVMVAKPGPVTVDVITMTPPVRLPTLANVIYTETIK